MLTRVTVSEHFSLGLLSMLSYNVMAREKYFWLKEVFPQQLSFAFLSQITFCSMQQCLHELTCVIFWYLLHQVPLHSHRPGW